MVWTSPFGVTQREFDAAREAYPSLTVCGRRVCPMRRSGFGRLLDMLLLRSKRSRRQEQIITGVTVEIPGIAGGSNGRRRRRYRLFANLTSIRTALPTVWVLDPPDSQIGHVNIYHPAASVRCSSLNKSLPMLCWGNTTTRRWAAVPPEHRLLEPFLCFLAEFLGKENHNSAAR